MIIEKDKKWLELSAKYNINRILKHYELAKLNHTCFESIDIILHELNSLKKHLNKFIESKEEK